MTILEVQINLAAIEQRYGAEQQSEVKPRTILSVQVLPVQLFSAQVLSIQDARIGCGRCGDLHANAILARRDMRAQHSSKHRLERVARRQLLLLSE